MKISHYKRIKVFTRDKFTCRYCKRKADFIKECKSPRGRKYLQLYVLDDWRPYEVDHKKPVALGGSNDTRNLLTACAKCNNKKSKTPYKIFISTWPVNA